MRLLDSDVPYLVIGILLLAVAVVDRVAAWRWSLMIPLYVGDRVRVGVLWSSFWGMSGTVTGPGSKPGHVLAILDGDTCPIQFAACELELHPADEGAP